MYLLFVLIAFFSCGNQGTQIKSSQKINKAKINDGQKKKEFEQSFSLSLSTLYKKELQEEILVEDEENKKIYWGYLKNIEIKITKDSTAAFYNIIFDENNNKIYTEENEVNRDNEGNITNIDFEHLDEGVYSLLISEKINENEKGINGSYTSDTLYKEFIFINFIDGLYFPTKIDVTEEISIKDGHLVIPSLEELTQKDLSTEIYTMFFTDSNFSEEKQANITNGTIFKIEDYIKQGLNGMGIVYKKVISYNGKKYYSDKIMQLITLKEGVDKN